MVTARRELQLVELNIQKLFRYSISLFRQSRQCILREELLLSDILAVSCHILCAEQCDQEECLTPMVGSFH